MIRRITVSNGDEESWRSVNDVKVLDARTAAVLALGEWNLSRLKVLHAQMVAAGLPSTVYSVVEIAARAADAEANNAR